MIEQHLGALDSGLMITEIICLIQPYSWDPEAQIHSWLENTR